MTESQSTAVRRLAGLALAIAAVIAVAPAAADASSLYVHSAKSGALSGGTLTLHGVGGNVTWTTTSGRSGVERVKRAHRQLFLPKRPATGTLHFAGQSGGEELAFELSQPRYDARRDVARYRAKPISKRAKAARAGTTRRFGAASLSVVPHASIAPGNEGGNDCLAGFQNYTWYAMQFVSDAKWDTNDWAETDTDDDDTIGSWNIDGDLPKGATWESDGWLWRGCANHSTWKLVTDPEDPEKSGSPPDVTIDFNLQWDWGGSPKFDCSTSNPRIRCDFDNGTQRWGITDTQRPPCHTPSLYACDAR